MATNNTDLHTAKSNAADEFYTAYEDIEKEMNNYDFSCLSVVCPCDDYRRSNFYKFFKDNFDSLKITRVAALCYPDGLMCEYDGKTEQIKQVGNGDFRNEECIKAISDYACVVTNPPFSLFRQFINNIIASRQLFIILGNINAITYREVFPHIVNKNIRLGVSIHSGDREFLVPEDYPLEGTACRLDEETGNKYIRVKGVRWFTNMRPVEEYAVKHTILNNVYDSTVYKKFDKCNAINVNSMKEIPYDYDDIMGCPITVMDKMNNSDALEFKTIRGDIVCYDVIGMLNSGNHSEYYDFHKPIIDGKCKFKRILIKKIR